MPLVAMVDAVRTVSITLNDGDWTALQGAIRRKQSTLVLACSKPGHPKTSRLGTRFFAHNPGSGACGEHPGETPQLLLAKTIIIEAATAAGWSADPEVRGDGWIADVLAERDGHKIAVEVQWSAQTRDEYVSRQERYAGTGVRCAWFTRHAGSVPAPSRELPVFLLTPAGDDMTGSIGDRELSLNNAVTALLGGRVQFREYVGDGTPCQTIINLLREKCWKCHRDFLIWNVTGMSATGRCGLTQHDHISYELFVEDRIEAAPMVRQAAAQAAADQPVPLATLARRSTKASGTTYLAFVCPCGAVCGDNFVVDLIREAAYGNPYRSITSPAGEPGLGRPHWCLDTGHGNCPKPPDGYAPPAPSRTSEQAQAAATVQQVGKGISQREALRIMFGGYT